MGNEADCTLRIGTKRWERRALLESDELIFRGTQRWKVSFKDVRAIDVRDGTLALITAQGIARLDLGERAAKWAQKIRSPRGRMDKLGVKPESRVGIAGIADAVFDAELAARTKNIGPWRGARGLDVVIAAVASHAELAQIREMKKCIAPAGGIWLVYLKGRREFGENDVRAAGIAAGLVDNKVMAFSSTQSALRLVIPIAARPKR